MNNFQLIFRFSNFFFYIVKFKHSQNTLINFLNNQKSRFKVLIMKIFSVFFLTLVLVLTFNCFQIVPQTSSYHFHTDCLKYVVQDEGVFHSFFKKPQKINHMLTS